MEQVPVAEIALGALRLYSMTHYDIIMGNDIARNVHSDVLIGHSIVIALGRCHSITVHPDVARVLMYYVLLHPIVISLFSLQKLQLYIKMY